MSHVSKQPNYPRRELHEDLLINIAKNLLTLEDFVRFGAVCRQGRSATLQKHHFPLFSKPFFPWLMLTQKEDDTHRAFFSPLENRLRIIELPEVSGCQCWGSPFGWLVTHRVHQGMIETHLLNPLSRIRIPLPSKVDTFDGFGVNPLHLMHKATIISITESGNKENMKYLVFATIGDLKYLVFARDGGDTWITIKCTTFNREFMQFNGVYYAVSYDGGLMKVDMLASVPVAKDYAQSPDTATGAQRFYLVDLNSELHMVVGRLQSSFRLYKFDQYARIWERVITLGDNVVFVGRNTSFALKASEYPGCKPDCIYFTDRKHRNDMGTMERENDMGIFNMKTLKFERWYEGDDIFSNAVWITPRIK